MKTKRFLTAAMALLGLGCAASSPVPLARNDAPACTAPAINDDGDHAHVPVRWVDHAGADSRVDLDRWCLAVGVPVVAHRDTAPVRVDSVAVVTWNVHLGAGQVEQFVADLRSGTLTGAPVQHFVLLLQEARRSGEAVPSPMPSAARSPRQLGEPDAASVDIGITAERLGLNLFYVPSMRNGAHAPEDRGNAILTTLPMTELSAIELPFLAQRRIAVAATLPLLDAAGTVRPVRVTSVHLDIGSDGRRPLALFGPGRTLQATALAEALAGGRNDVVGGDFNTWSLSFLERALTRMQADFPDFPAGPGKPTFYTAGVVPLVLDHLFLRGADVHGRAPARVDHRYGSDHYPLLAWIRLKAAGDVAGDVYRH